MSYAYFAPGARQERLRTLDRHAAAARKPRQPKQLNLAMDPARTCACGRERARNRIICPDCWRLAPAELRQQLRFGDQPARREAARLLIEHSRQQRNRSLTTAPAQENA